MIKVKSREAKLILAEELKRDDPETLDFLSVFAEGFGPAEQIDYTGPAENRARSRMVEQRKQAAASGIEKAREALKHE